MVAYSFKQQFAPAILSGAKCQTIRADRKRHAREGEAVQGRLDPLAAALQLDHDRLNGPALLEATA